MTHDEFHRIWLEHQSAGLELAQQSSPYDKKPLIKPAPLRSRNKSQGKPEHFSRAWRVAYWLVAAAAVVVVCLDLFVWRAG